MFRFIQKIGISLFVCIAFFACKKSGDSSSSIGNWKVGNRSYTATLTYPISNLNPSNNYYALVAMPKLASSAHPDQFQAIFKSRPSVSGTYKIQQKANNDLLYDEIRIEAWEENTSATAVAQTEGKYATVTVSNGKITVEVPVVNAVHNATVNGATVTTFTTLQGKFTEQ